MPSTKTVFFIGQEKFEVDVEQLSPREIVRDYANEDPEQNTLATREGNKTVKFNENIDTPIELKNGTKFFILHEAPLGVS
jgi:hypothetical protein